MNYLPGVASKLPGNQIWMAQYRAHHFAYGIMMSNDFHRAYHAFVAKQKPEFEGN